MLTLSIYIRLCLLLPVLHARAIIVSAVSRTHIYTACDHVTLQASGCAKRGRALYDQFEMQSAADTD